MMRKQSLENRGKKDVFLNRLQYFTAGERGVMRKNRVQKTGERKMFFSTDYSILMPGKEEL